VADGTVKVTPDGIAPAAVEVVVATVDPSNFTVTAELAAKSEPDTVTVEPTAPAVGLKAIKGPTAGCIASAIIFQLVVLKVYVGVYAPPVDPIWYSSDISRANPLYDSVVISVKPFPTVRALLADASNVPMTMSLAWVVVIEALPAPESPLLV